MQEFCHRCHGELPLATAGHKQSSDDAMLFCPRCSAPQIMLPEHMRTELAAQALLAKAIAPPPRLFSGDTQPGSKRIDWRVALTSGAVIALVAALLRMVGLKFPLFSLVWFFWILAGANLALAVYEKKRPAAWMDARVGMRIGLVTGILMCAAMAVAGGATGVIERYGLHGMTKFDEETAKGRADMQAKVQAWMQEQNMDPEVQKNYAHTMNSAWAKSPEVMAWGALFELGFEGLVLTAISAATGAVNGMMRGARLSRRRPQP